MKPVTRVLAFPKNGANAYLNLFAAQLEERGAFVEEFSFPRAFFRRYDVLQIHWPETHLRTGSWWRALAKHVRLALMCLVVRARRTRIVWTIHNLKPHEADHWISAALFPLWFPRLCTHVIALSSGGLAAARARHPCLQGKPSAIVPHGHYRDVYPPAPGRMECRVRLGVRQSAFTYLFFGHIRRYKNVPHLIEVFRQVPANDIQLVVAGMPALGVRREDLMVPAGRDGRCTLILRHIADEEVSEFFGAADLVVLPFREVLNSGSVLLALSMNRPVLAPRIGALPDIQRAVGERWLQLYDGHLTAAHLVRARTEAETIEPGMAADLSAFDWGCIGDATLDFYLANQGDAADDDRDEPPAGRWHMAGGFQGRRARGAESIRDRLRVGWTPAWPRGKGAQ